MKNNSPGKEKEKVSWQMWKKSTTFSLFWIHTRRKKRKNYHTKCLVLHVFTHEKRKFERIKK